MHYVPDARWSLRTCAGTAAILALVASPMSSRAADLTRQYDLPSGRSYLPHQNDASPRTYTAKAPISSYSWTGPYLGGNLGYQWGTVSHSPTEPSGIAGGIQGGYNWQFGQLVVGAEADATFSDARDRFASWKFSNPWFGTVRGRVGFALDRVLLYGTLGFAVGGMEAEFAGASQSRTHVGWTAGGGIEVGLASNWSVKVEYLFVDLADRSYALTGQRHGLESSILRIGVNYRF